MSAPSTQADPYVVLDDVPWGTYVAVTDVLGDFHLRHTYDRGTLEMRSLLHGVPWEVYEEFLRALGDYNLRHTYDRGTLELMAPLKIHEWEKRLLGRMVEALSLELDIAIQSVGSTTFRRAAGERGLQPDESYYIANEPLVRGKDEHDPTADPPPDLVIEVDVTSSSIDRLPVLAAMRVPEVWRFDGETVTFYGLNDAGEYDELEQSRSFPFVRPGDVLRCLEMRHETDENSVIRAFIEWVRERHTDRGD